MTRRRNSCEDCTTSLSSRIALRYMLQYPFQTFTLHSPQPSQPPHTRAELTTPQQAQSVVPLSMSAMRRCAKCKSSLGLGQCSGRAEKTLRQIHANIRTHTHTHSLRSCSAWAYAQACSFHLARQSTESAHASSAQENKNNTKPK